MKKGITLFNHIHKKASVMAVAAACTALFSCGNTARNDNGDSPTSADANSVQDTMAIDTGPGGGLAYDTSGTAMEGVKLDTITSTTAPRTKSPQDTSKTNVYGQ